MHTAVATIALFMFMAIVHAKPLEPLQRESMLDKCYRRMGMSSDNQSLSFQNGRVISADPRYPKFLTCYYEAVGFQKPNGDIAPGAIKDLLKDYSFVTDQQKDYIVTDCKMVQGKTPSEKAVKLLECLLLRVQEVAGNGEGIFWPENNEIDT